MAKRRNKKSIFREVILSMGMVMLGGILIIEIASLFLIHKDGQRAQELFEDAIDSYAVLWENKLNETATAMLGIVGIETGTLYHQLCGSEDKLTVESAKRQLQTQITELNARYGYELTTFVCVPERNIYISAEEKGSSYLQQQEMKAGIYDYIANHSIESREKWNVLYVQDKPFLFKIYKMDNGYIGSLYAAEKILNGMHNREENWFLEMVDSRGNIILEEGKSHRGVTVSYARALNYTNVEIRVTIRSARLYGNAGRGLFILLGAMMFSSLLVFLVFGRQRRNVFEPLEKLRSAMENYRMGDMDMRLPVVEDGTQIDRLYQTFNNMADQIQDLKIRVYETELEKQRVNSNYLKIQIQPHFYTNILNLIYGMAQVRDYTSIQKLSLACGSYFRYLLGWKGTFVPVREELKCLGSYIEIQRYRYQDRFETNICVEPELEEQPILPLVIQTFFANSLKHNIMRVPVLRVEASVKRTAEGKIEIRVWDNGIGFRKEILEKIEKNESIEKDGEHIGIQNVKERIREFYGQEADLSIESVPSSTMVTVLLPDILAEGRQKIEN